MGILEHPDIPKSIFGIQGFNPWNLLMLSVLIGWMRNKKEERYAGYFPTHIKVLIYWFVFVIFISHIRLIADMDGLIEWSIIRGSEPESVKSLFSEQIINSVKWLVPAFLLYKGCDTKERFKLAVFSILGIYIILGLQVIKWMPFGTITGGHDLSERSLKILVNEIGYHRVNLSMMLAGAFWAVISSVKLLKEKKYIVLFYLLSFTVLLGQMLTGGRTGYATWAVVGLTLGAIKWRKIVFITPFIAALVIFSVPGVYERLTHGIEGESVEMEINERAYEYEDVIGSLDDDSGVNLYAVTSGRSLAWPFVLEKISDGLLFGYGRMAMVNTGTTAFLWENLRESFPHPHNAYLELILDNGIIGAFPVMLLFLFFLLYSFRLFRDKQTTTYIVAGGVSLSLILAFLVASFGSQTFYPREGSVGMWCAIALMLRFYVNKHIAQVYNIPIKDGFLLQDEKRVNES
ncbi:MAG: O-antigen ligase family protein [Candidatus Thiodiazotropha sp. (ex Monitilora ramsayi)]|nr:O-antigen ligase family protein [Candidatus Thiodiazotropha sp. (ex Monitilora ramsayi)]